MEHGKLIECIWTFSGTYGALGEALNIIAGLGERWSMGVRCTECA